MTKEIKKVGVLGAGTMGMGIAAQLANAGIEVVLLDKFQGKAEAAIANMQKASPKDAFNAGFMVPENAKLIKTGTTDDNLQDLADCDWIIESILAPHPIREQLYKNVQKVAKPDAIFSSNTSTMQVEYMVANQDDDFKSRFMNTHFFNPVRFMHLLEVIPGKNTDPEMVKAISRFGDEALGKKVVLCKDERGFIANRIGIHLMERARVEALKQDMKIEDVDAILGDTFGFPDRLGVFRLADEVGLDVVEHVRSDLNENLPESDDFQQIFTGNEELKTILAEGYVGNRKPESKGGYYRLKTDEQGKPVLDQKGKKLRQARDLKSRDYNDCTKSPYDDLKKQVGKMGGLQKFLDSDHPAAVFAWPVIRDMMLYVLEHAEELAFDVQGIDDAMRGGYNWKVGPFELLDKMGVDWFTDKLVEENIAVPPLLAKAEGDPFYLELDDRVIVRHFDGAFVPIRREEGILDLDDVKRKSKPLITHNSASVWDIGDGVLCLEFHSVGNSIDPSILWVTNESVKLLNENEAYKAMVIYNDGDRFSVGANLKLAEAFMNVAENKFAKLLGVGQYAEKGLKNFLHEFLYQGQAVYTAINQSAKPIIGAPKGQPKNMSFGGGNEILLNCAAVQSGPEQIMALPEVGVGILPAWTGSTRILQRAFESATVKGAMASVIRAMEILADPLKSGAGCAQDGRKKLWLRPQDRISMNPDRVLADAKAFALEMAPDYKPEPLPVFNLPGVSGRAAIRMNVAHLYIGGHDPAKGGVNHVDVKVADRLATVLTGGDTLERDDVARHVASNHDHFEQLIDRKPKGHLGINNTIPLTYNRMLHLERSSAMDAFNDKASTWPRIHYILKNNAPLREPRLDSEPDVHEIRASMKHENLQRRDVTGEPLSGKEAKTLKDMADMTTAFYGLAKRGGHPVVKNWKALSAVKRVLGNF